MTHHVDSFVDSFVDCNGRGRWNLLGSRHHGDEGQEGRHIAFRERHISVIKGVEETELGSAVNRIRRKKEYKRTEALHTIQLTGPAFRRNERMLKIGIMLKKERIDREKNRNKNRETRERSRSM